MESQKRQRMTLVAAAVFSVGAGSYWIFGRDSDTARPAVLVQEDLGRKVRAPTEPPIPPRKTEAKPPVPAQPAVTPRKNREEVPENADPVRKPRPPEQSTVKERKVIQGC